jgi:DNA-binding LacI/PurR family transcriptional regulator
MSDTRRTTLKDVAAASGVSRATVSFVLNDTPNQTISPATRERVLQVSRDLGYVPHGIARALREGTSRIVVLHIETGMEGNYSRSYIRGLDNELAEHQHVLLVRHGPVSDVAVQQVLDAINPRAVVRFGEAYLDGRGPDLSGDDWQDSFAANAALQLRYLAEQGHTEVVVGMPEQEPPLTDFRLRYARQTAAQLGMAPLVTLPLPRQRSAATAALRALRAERPEVTAIAAHDDETGIRALAAARDLGLRVPGDLAVIGFDDTENGELTSPALTTVHIDAEAHGRFAARNLLGLDTAGLVRTPARVIVRESA